jgi:hypothetical protein
MVWATAGLDQTSIPSGSSNIGFPGLGRSNIDWSSFGISCTAAGGHPTQASPACTTVAPPMWSQVVGIGNNYNKGVVVGPPMYQYAPYAGIEYWKQGGVITYLRWYRYASAQDAIAGKLPTSPERFFYNSEGQKYASNTSPQGDHTQQMCPMGQIVTGFNFNQPRHSPSISSLSAGPRAAEAL